MDDNNMTIHFFHFNNSEEKYLKLLDVYASLESRKRVPWTWVYRNGEIWRFSTTGVVTHQAENGNGYFFTSVNFSRVPISVPDTFNILQVEAGQSDNL